MMSANLLMLLGALHVKAALFTTLVLSTVYASRRMSSQNRYLVMRMALAVVAVLPLLASVLPSYLIPLEWWPRQLTGSSTENATLILHNDAIDSESPAVTELPYSTETLLLVGYLLISSILLLRVAVGFLRTRMDIKRYDRIDQPNVLSLLDQVRGNLGVKHDVELVMDSSGAGPYVWGIRNQVVAVPKEFLAAAPDIQRTVLTHELIHIVRHDTTICLFSRLLCCLYWINPVVWLLNARLKLEMEQSCDDRAVCSGINAADYAGHLLNAIQQFDVRHRPNSAVAMARASSIKHRIRSLLSNHRQRGIMSTSKSVGILSTLLLLGTAIGALAAKSETNAALLEDVRSLVPENCDVYELRMAGEVIEMKGHCASALRVAVFMRNLERSGGKPFMRSMQEAANEQFFDMRLENLQSFALASNQESEATLRASTDGLVAGVTRLIPDNCDAKEIRLAANAMDINGHCATTTRVSAFMRNLERAGGKPSLVSVQTVADGFDYKMRLENLQSFAPYSAN